MVCLKCSEVFIRKDTKKKIADIEYAGNSYSKETRRKLIDTNECIILVLQPLHVGEILTVWKLVVLREHTYGGLIRTGMSGLKVALEGV